MLNRLRVFHLDDSIVELNIVKSLLTRISDPVSFTVFSFSNASHLMDRMKRAKLPDILLIDYALNDPDVDGVSLAKHYRSLFPDIVIIICSNIISSELGIAANQAGANNYIAKTATAEEFGMTLYNTYKVSSIKQTLSNPVISKLKKTIIGPTFQRLINRIPALQSSEIRFIHIEGEHGTGKSFYIQCFRDCLPRSTLFFSINSITFHDQNQFQEALLEVIGKLKEAKGMLNKADNAWLLLEDVDYLDNRYQSILFNLLRRKATSSVGCKRTLQLHFRILSTSTRSVTELVKNGSFLPGLWNILREASVEINPLRNRSSEIADYINFFSKTLKGGPYSVSLTAMEILRNYTYDIGNISELKNVLVSMTETKIGNMLTPLSIPDYVHKGIATAIANKSTTADSLYSLPYSNQKVHNNNIILKWNSDLKISFDLYCDLLLVELLRKTSQELIKFGKKPSFRLLSKIIGITRNTLASKIHFLIDRNILSIDEVTEWKRS